MAYAEEIRRICGGLSEPANIGGQYFAALGVNMDEWGVGPGENMRSYVRQRRSSRALGGFYDIFGKGVSTVGWCAVRCLAVEVGHDDEMAFSCRGSCSSNEGRSRKFVARRRISGPFVAVFLLSCHSSSHRAQALPAWAGNGGSPAVKKRSAPEAVG